MKNATNFLRIIALTAVIGFSLVACKNPAGPGSTNTAVTGVTLDRNTLSLTAGDVWNLTATIVPSNATNKAVTWTSSNIAVATVNDGTVTAIAAGTTTITVTTVNGGKTATCAITVQAANPNTIAVTGVTLNKSTITLTVGNVENLTATVAPPNATIKTVNWSSNNTAVATVNNGTVTAVAAGTATITVITVNSNKTATCVVTVQAIDPVNKTPVAEDYTIGNLTQTVGNITGVTIVAKTGKSPGAVTVLYNDSTTIPQTAGSYTVTFNVAAATGWNMASGLSAGTLSITKAAGATINTPTLNTKTYNSIAINAASTPDTGQTVEYAINTTDTVPSLGWQTDITFTGLSGGTIYYIFARAVGNDNYETGATNDRLIVTTLQIVPVNKIEYYWVNEHDVITTSSGTGNVTILPRGETLTIIANGSGYSNQRWYINGAEDTLQAGNITYSFSSEEKDAKRYTVALIVERGGKYYNANFAVTVTE